MKKEKYVYNPVTMQYEAVQRSWKSRFFRIMGVFCAAFITGISFYVVMDRLILSPQERIQQSIIKDLNLHVSEQTDYLDKLTNEVNTLQEKDANVHRVIFGMDPIDEALWEGGIGGSKKYDYITSDENARKQLKFYNSKLSKLQRKLDMQKASLDTLHALANERQDRLISIPSIKPIREDKLKYKLNALSGYGMRMHPVHKVKKHHNGIDFTAPQGTDIIATGKGKVVRVEDKKSGYGKNVMIDHGYGFHTLYGHMFQIDVKMGDEVVKGQKIGLVGSTGTSTAPHLHYEVRINGKPVNPVNYVLDGLTPSEYQELVNNALVENQSFD